MNNDRWFVKWEVVNFGDLMDDTQSLSVLRGASDLAEAAAREVQRRLSGRSDVRLIYAAASQALLLVDGDEGAAEALAGELEALSLEPAFQLTSAAGWYRAPVQALGEVPEDPGAAEEAARALKEAVWGCERGLEQRKACRLNVHPGAQKEDGARLHNGGKAALDGHDRLRLADDRPLPDPEGGKTPVSTWTRHRHEQGSGAPLALRRLGAEWNQEVDALQRQLKGLKTAERPQNDFSAVAAGGSHPNLIGLICADGNGFTALRERAPTVGRLQQLSQSIGGFIEEVLGAALAPELDELKRLNQALAAGERPARGVPLHRLLAAGDEFVLVCRAERALPIARAIHREAAALFERQQDQWRTLGVAEPLSFSVGAVVGHVSTPVRLLRQVAGELEHSAKTLHKGGSWGEGEARGATDFAVFKAAGVPENGVQALRAELMTLPLAGGGSVQLHARPYTPRQLGRWLERARTLRSMLPRGQVHRLARELPEALRNLPGPGNDELKKTYNAAVSRLKDLPPGAARLLDEALLEGLTQDPAVLPLCDLDELLEVVR